jgi:hypothetical protein
MCNRSKWVAIALIPALLLGLAIPVVQAQTTPTIPNQTFLPLITGAADISMVSAAATTDWVDVALLYDARQVSNFDKNFCKIAEFYGLVCQRIAMDATTLSTELLRDAGNHYVKLIGISADTLRADLFSTAEQDLLRQLVTSAGVHLYIGKLNDRHNLSLIQQLTNQALLRVTKPADSRRNWVVSPSAPEVVQEFGGLTLSGGSSAQADYCLLVDSAQPVTTLISSTDNSAKKYPIFARWQAGGGAVFLDAGAPAEAIESYGLTKLYYTASNFAKIIPLMMAMRYAGGSEVWRNPHPYANLTIDDPALQTVKNLNRLWKPMDYLKLLPHMQEHGFHTTIAWQPDTYQLSEPEIVALFVNYPDYYSLAQHGNNHDGFEFYKYKVTAADPYPARPYPDQQADIVEGLARMATHQQNTGIPYERIMVFPYGNAPAPTLELLKIYNFLASVQRPTTPLSARPVARWDFDMYPANLDYANFPLVRRIALKKLTDYQPLLVAQSLFLDKPVLLFSHPSEMFATGIHNFDAIADSINHFDPTLTWRDLGYILKRLYLQKENDDGSIAVLMQVSQLVLTNERPVAKRYVVSKEERLNVPIERVSADDQPIAYTVADGQLGFTLQLPAHASAEVAIRYQSPEPAMLLAAQAAPSDVENLHQPNAPVDDFDREEEPTHLIYLPVVCH